MQGVGGKDSVMVGKGVNLADAIVVESWLGAFFNRTIRARIRKPLFLKLFGMLDLTFTLFFWMLLYTIEDLHWLGQSFRGETNTVQLLRFFSFLLFMGVFLALPPLFSGDS